MSAGGGRLVAVVAMKGDEEPMFLVVEVADVTRLMELKDEVLSDADWRLLFDSLLEPNFLKNEGILVDAGERDDSRVSVAILFVGVAGEVVLIVTAGTDQTKTLA